LNEVLNKNIENIQTALTDYLEPIVKVAVLAVAISDMSKSTAVAVPSSKIEQLMKSANNLKYCVEKYMAMVVVAMNYVIAVQQLKEIDRDKFTEELTMELLKPQIEKALKKYLPYVVFSGSGGTMGYLFQLINDIGTDTIVSLVMGAIE